MPLKIVELEITDFRGIEHLELSFRDPQGDPASLVVLAGPNGCGKTTILEAVLLATEFGGLARGKFGPSAVRTGANDYSIRARFQNFHDGTPHERTFNKSRVPIAIEDAFPIIAYFSSCRGPKLVGSLGITAGPKIEFPEGTEVNRLWRLKQYLIDALAIELFEKQRAANGRPQTESAYEYALSRLHRVWRRFYPDQTLAVEPVGQSPDGGFDLFVSDPSKGRVSVDNLSSGQLELLQFCGDFLVSSDQLNLLVIDEPELHLDPAWHTQIIRAIQDLAPETQLIVGTHSPEIYDSAMSFERHFLVPDDDPRAAFWARSNELCEAAS